MTDIDPAVDIVIAPSPEQIGVKIPLSGHMTEEFRRCYRRLAQDKQVLAEARDEPDRSWLLVRVPAVFEPKRVQAMLDAACDLIPGADVLANAPPATARAEAAIREWWADRTK